MLSFWGGFPEHFYLFPKKRWLWEIFNTPLAKLCKIVLKKVNNKKLEIVATAETTGFILFLSEPFIVDKLGQNMDSYQNASPVGKNLM